MKLGVISDTHGLLRPEALKVLRGSDLIVHAGDIGKASIVQALEEIAPLRAVRGNVDKGAWAERFPLEDVFEVEGVTFYVYHGHLEPKLSAAAAGFGVVISGHSHVAGLETRGNALYLNPGSAGPKRFKLAVSLANVTVEAGKAQAELVYLDEV